MKQGTNYYASCETFPNINIHEPQAGHWLGFPARELVQFGQLPTGVSGWLLYCS